MTYYNDPYGVGRLKAREMLERERYQKKDLITKQIARELKSISERLQELESKL
ncbi:MAG TPA: hypothetical protein GXZ27_09320 [Thermoanaerobacterales bacterium]|jgi:hypothetical protein|nr:hypothetical protein [Thermoanaerobacterales bacterium]